MSAPSAYQIIQTMADRLVERFDPTKVILFGSYARGDWDQDSDVDLLVVVPSLKDRRKLRIEMRRAITGMGLPKDIVLLTESEFEARKNVPGTIAYPANSEGHVLYARQ